MEEHLQVELVEFIECESRKAYDDCEKKERHRQACKRYYEKNKDRLKKKSLQNYYKRTLKSEGDDYFLNKLSDSV